MPASNGAASASGLQNALVTTRDPKEIAARQRRLPAKADGYILCQQIGRGTAACVYRALLKPKNDDEIPMELAIKVIDLEWLQAPLDDIWREIQVMSLSSHPNVVPFSTSFVNGADLWIVMPLLTGGSVLDLMSESYPNGLPEPLAVYVIFCVLNAINYFHDNNQIHRDVKARNVLLDSKGNVMLSDYGMMGWMVEGGWERKQRQTFIGTPCWMAPEVMEQANGYDYKADIWSLGITAIEIAQGMAPYSTAAPMKVLLMTLQNPPPTLEKEASERFSSEYKDFISTCLQKDPTQRPNSKELLQHALFASGVSVPADLESILAKLPPIHSRGGSGQNNLIQQLNKNHTVARSGIFELSSKGQGWDFGDGDFSVPESSSDTLITEELPQNGKAGNTGGISHFGDILPTERRLSALDDGAGRTSPPNHFANRGFLPTESVSGITSGLPAKTVGMLQRKGRFTVSDVGDKVEHRIADFLDDDSSGGGISNSSSFMNMTDNPANNEGSPSGLSNGHSHPSKIVKSTPIVASVSMPVPVSVPLPVSAAPAPVNVTVQEPPTTTPPPPPSVSVTQPVASNNPPSASVSNLPPSATVTTNSQPNGGASAPQGSEDPTERVRRGRFEVFDIESSGTAKNNPIVRASTLSSSNASTPNQSGIMRSSKPRSRGRFEVKDVEPVARLPAVAAISTQTATGSPRRTAVATPSIQSQSNSQPSVLQQSSVISQQVNPGSKTTDTAQPRVNTEQVQQSLPSVTENLPPTQIPPVTTHTRPVDPRLVQSQPAANITPTPAPPHAQPPPPVAMPRSVPELNHNYSSPGGNYGQGRLGYQTLMNVSNLQNDLIGMMHEHERVKQENEYFRQALSTSQHQMQIQTSLMGQLQSHISLMGQQIFNLQLELSNQRQQHQQDLNNVYAQIAALRNQRPAPVSMEMFAPRPQMPVQQQERVFAPPARPTSVQPGGERVPSMRPTSVPVNTVPMYQQQHMSALMHHNISQLPGANANLLGQNIAAPSQTMHQQPVSNIGTSGQVPWQTSAPPQSQPTYSAPISSQIPVQHTAPSQQMVAQHPAPTIQIPVQHSAPLNQVPVQLGGPPSQIPVQHNGSSQQQQGIHPSAGSQSQQQKPVHHVPVSTQIPAQHVVPPPQASQQLSVPPPSAQHAPTVVNTSVGVPSQKAGSVPNGVVAQHRPPSSGTNAQRQAPAQVSSTAIRQQPSQRPVMPASVNTSTTRTASTPRPVVSATPSTTRTASTPRPVVSASASTTPAKSTLATHVAASNAVHQHLAAASAAAGRPGITSVRSDATRLAHSVSAPNNSLTTHPSQTEYNTTQHQQQHPSQMPIDSLGPGLPTTASAPSLSLTDNGN